MGVGDGIRVGEGIWAKLVAIFSRGVTTTAAPTAGTSFTNVRRLKLPVPDATEGFLARLFFECDLFMVRFCSCAVPSPGFMSS
jgi:hypothetical protein